LVRGGGGFMNELNRLNSVSVGTFGLSNVNDDFTGGGVTSGGVTGGSVTSGGVTGSDSVGL